MMKKPRKPGDLISKMNAKKKHHKLEIEARGSVSVPKSPFKSFPNQMSLANSFGSKPTSFPASMLNRASLSHKRGKKKKAGKKHHKNWIAGAIKHPGALHRELGVKAGKKIPAKTLAKAASKGGKLGARARLAETLKGLHHKKGNDHDADDKMKKHRKHSVKHKAGMHCKGC